QDVATSNTLAGVVDLVNQFIIPGDYDYTTASGTKQIGTGDLVRLGSTYANGGDTGAVYRYLGGLSDIPTYIASNSGTQNQSLVPGNTVRLPDGWAGGGVARATERHTRDPAT